MSEEDVRHGDGDGDTGWQCVQKPKKRTQQQKQAVEVLPNARNVRTGKGESRQREGNSKRNRSEGVSRSSDWSCHGCQTTNGAKRSNCTACGAARPSENRWPNMKPGDWVCPNPKCGRLVWAKYEACIFCETPWSKDAYMLSERDHARHARRAAEAHANGNEDEQEEEADEQGSDALPSPSLPPADDAGENGDTMPSRTSPVPNGNGDDERGTWAFVARLTAESPTPGLTKAVNASVVPAVKYVAVGKEREEPVPPPRTRKAQQPRTDKSSDATSEGSREAAPLPKGWKIGDWLCPKCNRHNYASKETCLCATRRPSDAPRYKKRAARPGDWVCSKTHLVYGQYNECGICHEKKTAKSNVIQEEPEGPAEGVLHVEPKVKEKKGKRQQPHVPGAPPSGRPAVASKADSTSPKPSKLSTPLSVAAPPFTPSTPPADPITVPFSPPPPAPFSGLPSSPPPSYHAATQPPPTSGGLLPTPSHPTAPPPGAPTGTPATTSAPSPPKGRKHTASPPAAVPSQNSLSLSQSALLNLPTAGAGGGAAWGGAGVPRAAASVSVDTTRQDEETVSLVPVTRVPKTRKTPSPAPSSPRASPNPIPARSTPSPRAVPTPPAPPSVSPRAVPTPPSPSRQIFSPPPASSSAPSADPTAGARRRTTSAADASHAHFNVRLAGEGVYNVSSQRAGMQPSPPATSGVWPGPDIFTLAVDQRGKSAAPVLPPRASPPPPRAPFEKEDLWTCSNCQKKMPAEYSFCGGCGKKQYEDKTPVAPEPPKREKRAKRAVCALCSRPWMADQQLCPCGSTSPKRE